MDPANAQLGPAEEASSQQVSGSEQDECLRIIACFVWAHNRLGVAFYDSFTNEVGSICRSLL